MGAVNKTVAEQLGEHLVGLDYETLPANVIQSVKEAVLDNLGCQLIGSTLDWCKIIYDFIEGFAGKPESSVVNHTLKTWPHDAAFANATFGHACELDDHMDTGGGHPGATSVGVSFALGEKEKANGREIIAAIAACYETSWRLGRAMMPESLERGWHSQSLIGVFAAAATAGRLLKLNPTQLAHALAIAGSHASGTREYTQSGGEVKRMHSGISARAGIQSALLAKAGLTGPLTIFEGKQGILALFCGKKDATPIIEGFRDDFGALHIEYKYYPVNISAQSAVGLVSRLLRDHAIQTADVERIDVTLRGGEHSVLSLGTIREPKDALGAQFSLPFSLAIAVVKRSNALGLYTDPAVRQDPVVLEMIKKIHLHPDPLADQRVGLGVQGSMVKMTLTDGKVLDIQEKYQKGHRNNPLTPEEFADKFRGLASAALSQEKAEEVIKTVNRLEELEDIAQLTSLLR